MSLADQAGRRAFLRSCSRRAEAPGTPRSVSGLAAASESSGTVAPIERSALVLEVGPTQVGSPIATSQRLHVTNLVARSYLARVPAGRSALQPQKTDQQQARADEEHNREGDLADDERRAEFSAARA